MTEFTPAQKEALDVSRSVGVTASAGTGKTFLLQNRFVKLLSEGDAHPHQILCLTYTDKAAAEMQDKIEQELRKQSDAEVKRRMEGGMTQEEAEENKLTKALGSIHQCTISTFHGFCSGLLHEFPFEADVPVSYSIMDSLAVHDLVNTTISEILHHPDETLWNHVTVLFRNIGNENSIASGIKSFLDKWETYASWFAYLQEHPKDVVAEWNAWKENLVESTWQEVIDDPKLQAYHEIENTNKKSIENLQKLALNYRQLQSASTLDEKRQLLAEFADLKIPGGAKYGGLNEYYEDVRDRIGKFIKSTVLFEPDDVNSQRMIDVLQAFAAVTAHVHDAVRERKREGGYLDFGDLISHVESLLDHNEDICRELRSRYRYILVDEVQDNDPILTKIVRTLAEDPKRNNKLFAVGDMKQAIYGFRGADPAGFKEILGDFARKPVELDVNYRTVPFLIDAINTVFSGIYAPGNQDGIPYTNVSASRKTDVGSFTILYTQNSKAKPNEAEQLASWIHDRIANQDLEVCDSNRDNEGNVREVLRKASYRDIAILIRAKSSLKALIPALKSYNIPFHVYKGNGFYEEQEISDLMNVIRASVFHENEPALYGALISPYFGISDEQLAFALTEVLNDDDTSEPQKRKEKARLWDRLCSCADVQIQAALQQLDRFRTAAFTLPVSAFVRLIIRETGILSVYGALEDGVDRIHNVRKFLDAAGSLEAGKGFGIMEFIQTIETCIKESIADELGAAEADADTEDRVQIMTVHVSKGLEFKVVVLYRTAFYYKDNSAVALSHPKYHCGCRKVSMCEDSNIQLFAFLDYLINEDLKPELTADERRLFYVGMTRPRDHLVMTHSGKNPAEMSFMSFYEKVSAGVPAEKIEVCEHYPPEIEPEDASVGEHRKEIMRNLPVGLGIAVADEKEGTQEVFRYGSCIHELFEGHEDRETICRRYGYGPAEMEGFERILAAFRKSPILKDIETEWHELSFTNEKGKTRRADMLIRYTDGSYRIIDFKSDDFSTIPDDRRKEYFEQLTEYANCLGTIFRTGSPIPACFYATADGVFIDLDDILTYKPSL